MDDEAILASLDRDPDAFADFYRRHSGRLLEYVTGYTPDDRLAAEICAETFAAALTRAHRFDPERGSAAEWLEGIARRLLARARQRGFADDRSRRRLGLAELAPGDRFLAELEEELVEAARFRAARRRPRPRPQLPALPRPPARAVRAALAGVAALALAAGVAALALGGGDDPPRPEPVGAVAQLVPMLPAADCPGHAVRRRPAVPAMPHLALFQTEPRIDDALRGEVTGSLPIGTLDPRETRLAANGRRGTRLHAVPSLAISDDTGCAADDGPGVCLVDALGGTFRCFTIAAVSAGRAFVRTDRGSVAGIVPDGFGRVTLSSGTRRASATISRNVYEAELGVPSGTRVGVVVELPGESGCEREAAPGLLARVAALRRAPTERLVPMAALSHLREYAGIEDVAERGARFWGSERGVEFWAIPVVRTGARDCAPATAVCIAAVTVGDRADAECGLSTPRTRATWRFAPLLAEHAVIYGTAPDGVTGVLVHFETLAVEIPARDNVIAGVLPFPYDDSARVELLRRPILPPPRVGVVGAGGDARAMLERLVDAGYEPLHAVGLGVKRQPRTVVYWRPRGATRAEAAAVRRAAGAAELIRIESTERTPRPVLEAAAPVVVVVGSG